MLEQKKKKMKTVELKDLIGKKKYLPKSKYNFPKSMITWKSQWRINIFVAPPAHPFKGDPVTNYKNILGPSRQREAAGAVVTPLEKACF